MAFPPGFSIVLCTHNGESRLKPTLIHLAALRIPPKISVELILVNNASTDNTDSVVQKIWIELGEPFSLRILHENNPGKGYAVETGYDAANFSFIVTVDDDNWLFKDYLIEAYAIIEKNPTIGLIGGQSIGAFESPKPNWFNKVSAAYAVGKQAEDTGQIKFVGQILLWGAGLLVNTIYWKNIRQQGFKFITSKRKGKAVGEDSELCIVFQAFGYSFYYSDNLKLQHWMPDAKLEVSNCLSMFKGFGVTHVYFELYHILYYKIKTKRKVVPIIIYSSMLKSKCIQLINAKLNSRTTSDPENALVAKFLYESAKAELVELLQLTNNLNNTLQAIQHNLKIRYS